MTLFLRGIRRPSGKTEEVEYDEAAANAIPPLGAVLLTENSAQGRKIVNLGDPSDPQDAVTKTYVDSVAVQKAVITISVAELLTIHTTPKQILAAPGVGKLIMPYAGWWLQIRDDTVSDIPYVGTWVPTLGIYNNSQFSQLMGYVSDVGPLREDKFGVFQSFPSVGGASQWKNKPLLFGNDGNALTEGNGTLKVFVLYTVLTL